jgi:hypothetical protein
MRPDSILQPNLHELLEEAVRILEQPGFSLQVAGNFPILIEFAGKFVAP